MKIRLNEDYYQWCCEWCDSENRVLWARVGEELTCGACHKKQFITNADQTGSQLRFSAGLC